MQRGRLELKDVPEPPMSDDHMLVELLAAGVCGGDLNALEHADEFLHAAVHAPAAPRSSCSIPIVTSCSDTSSPRRVAEVGARVKGYAPGDVLLVSPAVVDPDGVVHCVGYASDYPGAGSRSASVVSPYGHVPIPDGVSPYEAAAVDPLATGLNGVWRSRIEPPAGAIITGCGPVGLGALAALVERGIHPIVVSDPSATRREVARSFGAHVVVDPSDDDPVSAWRISPTRSSDSSCTRHPANPACSTRCSTPFRRTPRVTVVGACMVDDPIRPIVGIYKNVTIEFCFGMGPDGDEYPFAATFERLADGRIDASKLVTGYAGLEGVEEVFAHLRPGDYRDIDHMKILIRHDIDGPGIRGTGRGADDG